MENPKAVFAAADALALLDAYLEVNGLVDTSPAAMEGVNKKARKAGPPVQLTPELSLRRASLHHHWCRLTQ